MIFSFAHVDVRVFTYRNLLHLNECFGNADVNESGN
jgi:hypothetical protein